MLDNNTHVVTDVLLSDSDIHDFYDSVPFWKRGRSLTMIAALNHLRMYKPVESNAHSSEDLILTRLYFNWIKPYEIQNPSRCILLTDAVLSTLKYMVNSAPSVSQWPFQFPTTAKARQLKAPRTPSPTDGRECYSKAKSFVKDSPPQWSNTDSRNDIGAARFLTVFRCMRREEKGPKWYRKRLKPRASVMRSSPLAAIGLGYRKRHWIKSRTRRRIVRAYSGWSDNKRPHVRTPRSPHKAQFSHEFLLNLGIPKAKNGRSLYWSIADDNGQDLSSLKRRAQKSGQIYD
ncbi:hypothetical protein EDD18DRAFT_1112385 [Armillaria luteobubalina]|uniref:Uncharacterized protein n=1 Tax=Armillaria luteobubalina TaxID=153913 RepID=A0AA39PFX7_9AGAR|nr:hypothetical protein EDD18DRAFT_1112385 [Armillaria luteobubalina]